MNPHLDPVLQYRPSELETVNACDLCGGKLFHEESVVDGWILVRCDACNVVFTSPRYTEAHLQKLYSERYYERDSGYLFMQIAEPSEDEYHLAKSLIKMCEGSKREKSLRSLDIGCGAGRIVKAFKDSGWEAVGIDLNLRAVTMGINRSLDLRVGSLDSRQIGKFNLITGFHVLEHVHSPSMFLQQCVNRLSENGYLLLEVPDYGCRAARKMGPSWPYLYPDGHLYQFTAETLARYLVQSGFRIVRIEKVHGRGPLENSRASGGEKEHKGKLKNALFALRHLFYWSSKGRRVLRCLFWDVLGYGEFIRILARKIDRNAR